MAKPDDMSWRLQALSAETLGVDPCKLSTEARLVDDLGVDSLAAIEWGMTIEDEFRIVLPTEAWEQVASYGMVEDLVRGLVHRAALS